MKKLITLLLLLLTVSQCSSYIKHSKTAGVDLTGYRSVFLGWIDFPEEDWVVLRYSSKEDWHKAITYINKYFQKNSKQTWRESVPHDVSLSYAQSKNDKPSSENDLYIKFVGVEIVDEYYIHTSVQFIDLKNNKILFEIPQEHYGSGRRNLESKMIMAADNVFWYIIWEFEHSKK